MKNSLDQFHDVIVPPAVGIFPLAEGWIVIGAIFVGIVLYFGVERLRYYLRNRYRREALRELQNIAQNSPKSFEMMLKLLRRTALSAYGREAIASLENDAWWEFLNGEDRFFLPEHAQCALELLYEEKAVSNELSSSFKKACEAWITQHKDVKS